MSQTKLQRNIGFLGAGSMAEAMIRGLIDLRITEPHRIAAMNRTDEQRLNVLTDRYGIETPRTQEQREQSIRQADIVVLGIKPKDAPAALTAIKHLLQPHQLIVSVVAGLSIDSITSLLDNALPVVRTMPNIASTVGMGATGMSFSAVVTEQQKEEAMALFRAIGEVAIVEETQLNIVTGVSGSGPAYVYYLMEAMMAAGIADGLPEETARKLTIQTVLGAAHLIQSTGESPKELRRKVTSPNGTTQAAIELMEAGNVRDYLTRAVLRAAERSQEMGKAIERDAQMQQGKQVYQK